MKVSRGTKVKIVTNSGKLLEYPIIAFYDYKDRNPTIGISQFKSWVSEFDVMTGDEFIWGQGQEFYSRREHLELSQLPLQYIPSIQSPLDWDLITVIIKPKNIFQKIKEWAQSKYLIYSLNIKPEIRK